MADPEDRPRMGQLMEEAAVWFARMRGPDAESFRPEFEHWLALGAAHRGAYNRAGEIFAMGRFLAAEKKVARSPANDDRPARWRWAAIAAGVALVVSFTAWIVSQQKAAVSTPPVQITESSSNGVSGEKRYATEVGERRSVRLADGSLVELDGGSELTVQFDASSRQLTLERGRARFDVAHENRPFIVQAGGGSVTARGTLFDVILGDNKRVTVRLLRGAVDVERPSTGASPSARPAVARLEPGETLSFALIPAPPRGGVPSTAQSHSFASVPAPSLVREFEQVPLSAVVAEANRGSSTLIKIADPDIGALKVSGRFHIDDTEQVAERLAALFDLDAERTKSGEITLRRH